MPFTPFHMGPGAAVKAVLGDHFSLVMFGLSQVLIDIEPLVRIIRGDSVLHGLSHTYIGATAIGLLSVAIARPFYWVLSNIMNALIDPSVLLRFGFTHKITWVAAFSGALIGTYSHIALDSIMHADIAPLYPFSRSNALLGLLSFDALHLMCMMLGVFGVIGICIRAARNNCVKRDQRSDA